MPKLLEIGDGAFKDLGALQHFDCQHNLRLQSIHKDAFVRPGEDAKQHGVWPPIRSVSLNFNWTPPHQAIFSKISYSVLLLLLLLFQLLLNNNNISVIDQGLMARWDEIEKIDIRINPIRCDCETQWLIDTLVPQINSSKNSTGVHEIVWVALAILFVAPTAYAECYQFSRYISFD